MKKLLTKVLSLISLSLLLSSCNSFFGGNFFGSFNQNSGNDGSNVDPVPSSSSYNDGLIEAEDSVVYVLHNNVEKSSYHLFYHEVDWNGSKAKEFLAYRVQADEGDTFEISIYGEKVTKYTVMSYERNKLTSIMTVKEDLHNAFFTIRTNNFTNFYPYLFSDYYIPLDNNEADYIQDYAANNYFDDFLLGDLNYGKGNEYLASNVTHSINYIAEFRMPMYIIGDVDSRPARFDLDWHIGGSDNQLFIRQKSNDETYYNIDLAYVDIDGQFTSHEFLLYITTKITKIDGYTNTYYLATFRFVINHA